MRGRIKVEESGMWAKCSMTVVFVSVCFIAGCGEPSGPIAPETNAAGETAPDSTGLRDADRAAGPAPVHQSDELAAHPSDPDRMADGVAMEDIIPRSPLMASEQAVAEFPEEARFRYQLGRALEASGRLEEAFATYAKAAEMGHRMAYLNIGISYADGRGVAADSNKARENLQRAVDQGVAVAQELLATYVFSSAGFSNGPFFQAFYEGNFNEINADATDVATYLATFIEPFTATDGCGMVISRASFTRMTQHAQMAVLGRMLGTMAASRHDHASGDFAGAAAAGYRAGASFNVDVAAMVDRGRDDAQLFYERYGCRSPVADTFFENVERYGNSLGSASFTRELEKNFQR